jgi:hypothetical protein
LGPFFLFGRQLHRYPLATCPLLTTVTPVGIGPKIR